jgi:cytochrome P450
MQQKARQEAIRILCGDDDEPKMDIFPTTEQTKEMRYILQIIKETLRYNGTVVSLVIPRVVANDHTIFS